VKGNINHDLAVPEAHLRLGHDLRAALGKSRPVWIAASTHEGEEAAALEAHRQLLKAQPDAGLILVPRHPQRFADVARLLNASGLRWLQRSQGLPEADTQVFLGDSMGEMFAYFAAADLAFVGGSLVPVGGHNVLEPAALGLPVLFGPQMHNFVAARDLLLESEAAAPVADTADLARQLAQLCADPARRLRMGQAGKLAVAANRGALHKLLQLLAANTPG